MAHTLTPSDLLSYDGSDPTKPVYIAVKGIVYDVSSAREFYGKGGPYEVFAGRECARALAIMKVDAAECNSQLEDCSEKQLKTLQDWITKFNAKYPVVGQLLLPAMEPSSASPEHKDDQEQPDLSLLLPRTGPSHTSMLISLLLVLLLTVLGGVLLYLEIQESPPHGTREEL